jgi:protease I
VSKRVVLVIAHSGYCEQELEAPLAALKRAKIEVEVASSSLAPATGMGGTTHTLDLLYSAVDPVACDALVFVGGTGASEYFHDRTAHALARAALEGGRLVGAICYGPSILANAGVLEARRATCDPSRALHLRAKGVEVVDEPVVLDGALLTGRGPDDAEAFAKALVEALG